MQDRQPQQQQPNLMGGRRQGPGAVLTMEKPKLHNVRGTLLRLCRYLLDKWPVLAVAFACALATTIITIIGTRLNGYTLDTFIAQKDVSGLMMICLVMAGMYLIGVISSYGQNALMIRAAQRTSAAIRRDLFHRVQRLPLAYLDAHSSGDLMSRLTNDVDNIASAMAQNVVQLFTSVISIAGMLIAMLLLSPLLTLLCLVMTPITFVITRTIARRAQRFFVTQQRELGQMNGYVEEMISGQKIVKLFSREERVRAAFEENNGRLVASTFRAQAISGVIGPCNNMVNNLAYLVLAVAGGICIARGLQGITVGVIFTFLLYMRNFTNPINNILTLMNTIQLALASGERVFEIMDEPIETDAADATSIDTIQGRVDMNHITFSYVPGKPVLKDATLAAKPGQTVAIVGPTGAGKTTIINLLTKFYDIDGGSIEIDGRDISKLTRENLRRSVSMVLQDTFLFSDTIRENIRYGRIDASDAEVERAARQAHAHEFIMQLSDGYDTILSDNGQNLSQGQRQLLSIARAILSDASVLILDEATSSVDTRTEMQIHSALLKLMKGKTSFVIAHRLSTIRSADVILVIREGKVEEQGTHEELLKQKGFYAELYYSQFKTGIAI